jgi:DNA repair photolyase
MAKIKSVATETLFPILQTSLPGVARAGLARLAAEAKHADDGHLIEFKAMKVRSLVNKTVSKRKHMFELSINPYRGCEFGCKYCFARYTHEFLEPAPISAVPKGIYDVPQQSWALKFEREIYLKENAAWLLEQELRKIGPENGIVIGTATDPYQPIERRVGITRSILEVFAQKSGYSLGIITKSSLIARDVGLLARIAERNTLTVHHTITTTDSALARKIEPRAPRPDLRFAALRKLRQAGIRAGVLCSPLLPGINDSLHSLDAVASRAAAAGASFFAANPLFLKSCSRPTWMQFVREHFPDLAPEYARRYAHADFADSGYKKQTQALVRAVCKKHGIGEREKDAMRTGISEAESVAGERKGPATVRAERAQVQQVLFA